MAHSKSAEKRHRQSLKGRERNRAVRSLTRTAFRKALVAIQAEPASAEGSVLEAVSVLDRAAKKGVVHPNNAARSKSRLMARYNAALASPPEAVSKAAPKAAPKRRRAAPKAETAAKARKRVSSTKAAAASAEPKATEKKAPARRGLRLGRRKAEEK